MAHSDADGAINPLEGGSGTPRYRAYVLGLLLLVHIFSFLDRMLMGILAPAIKQDLALTDSMLGLMTGLSFALLYVGSSIPISFLADRFNRARIVAGALAFWSVCTSLCGVAGSAGHLFLARMAVGVGEGGGTAPAHALVADYFPKAQRGRALSIYSFGVPLGSAIGMLLGAYLLAAFDWRTAFLIIGALGLPLSLLFFLTVGEPRHAVKATLQAPVPFGEAIRSIGSQPAFWFVSLGAATAAMMGYGLLFWMPSFLSRSHGMAMTTVALWFGATTAVGGVAGNILGGLAGDRLAKRFGPGAYCLVPAIGFACSIPFVIVALLVEQRVVMFASLLGPAIAAGAAQPTIITAIQHIAGVRTRAVASAMMMLVNTLIGLALGTALLGFISDHYVARFGQESLRYAILTGTVFYAIAAVLLFFGYRAFGGDRAAGMSSHSSTPETLALGRRSN